VNLIVVLWRWKEGTEYAGTCFWAVYDCANPGRFKAFEAQSRSEPSRSARLRRAWVLSC
jgi:hypothetical protein